MMKNTSVVVVSCLLLMEEVSKLCAGSAGQGGESGHLAGALSSLLGDRYITNCEEY